MLAMQGTSVMTVKTGKQQNPCSGPHAETQTKNNGSVKLKFDLSNKDVDCPPLSPVQSNKDSKDKQQSSHLLLSNPKV